jgi:hypothetical protein
VAKVWDVGVSAYTHWQVSDDSGSALTTDPNLHDRFYSIGPEVQYFHQKSGLFFSLRYQFEIDARDRPEGRNLVFSIVKQIGAPGKYK